eukprot:UN05015
MTIWFDFDVAICESKSSAWLTWFSALLAIVISLSASGSITMAAHYFLLKFTIAYGGKQMMEDYFKKTTFWRPFSRICIYLSFAVLYFVIAIYGYCKLSDVNNTAAILSVIIYSISFFFLLVFLKKWFAILEHVKKEVVAARNVTTHPDHDEVYQPKTRTPKAKKTVACVIL